MTDAAVWPAINVPYLVDQVQVEGPLTLSAGSQFIVDTGGTFNVRTDGTVNAQGTALAPIEFLGSAPTPGHWDGFSFTFSRGPHTFDHVSIAHAGGGGTPATRGAVSGLCTTSSPVTINVSNTTISNSASNGIYGNADTCTFNVDNSTTTFSNITGENILIDP